MINRNLRDDQMISDPMTIAEWFSEYFTHIAGTLADKIPAAPHFNNFSKQPSGINILFSHNSRKPCFEHYQQLLKQFFIFSAGTNHS